jgi:hypothetical protein
MSVEDSPMEQGANSSQPCPISQKGWGPERASTRRVEPCIDILSTTPRAWGEAEGTTATSTEGISRGTGSQEMTPIRDAERSTAISAETRRTRVEDRGATSTSGAVGTSRWDGGRRASERRTAKPAFRHQVKLPEKP